MHSKVDAYFSPKLTGRDHGISDPPGLLQQEAGKEMDGRSMRKIEEYLLLVEPLFRLSTAGKKESNFSHLN